MYLWVSVLVKPPQKEWCWEFASRFGCVLTHALYIGGGFIDFHSQEQHTFGVLLCMLSVHVHVESERERERITVACILQRTKCARQHAEARSGVLVCTSVRVCVSVGLLCQRMCNTRAPV